jgi:hypothetical protein
MQCERLWSITDPTMHPSSTIFQFAFVKIKKMNHFDTASYIW